MSKLRTLTPALSHGERESYSDVVLVGRLRDAIRRLNPAIPEEAREEALRKVLRVGTPRAPQPAPPILSICRSDSAPIFP